MCKNNFRPPLPLSLKRKRKQRIIIRSVVCFLLLASFIFIIIMWGNKLFPITFDYRKGYTGLRILFYVLFLCVPFLVTGIPLKLIDKSWSGTITSITVVEKLATTDNPKYIYPFPKQDLILTIQNDQGKEIKYTVLSLSERNHRNVTDNIGKIHYHTHEFCVGDRVHKYYGYKHLFVSYQKTHKTKYCISCGSKNNLTEIKCWYCSSELRLQDHQEEL